MRRAAASVCSSPSWAVAVLQGGRRHDCSVRCILYCSFLSQTLHERGEKKRCSVSGGNGSSTFRLWVWLFSCSVVIGWPICRWGGAGALGSQEAWAEVNASRMCAVLLEVSLRGDWGTVQGEANAPWTVSYWLLSQVCSEKCCFGVKQPSLALCSCILKSSYYNTCERDTVQMKGGNYYYYYFGTLLLQALTSATPSKKN